jgi:glycosyltransferase involved in cell wall biosynthesis
LIHAASLIPVKDQATLLRALARLDDGSLEIIGEGPERDRLQSLAGELRISERVIFSGAVPHTEMPARYRSAALHVLTSRHEGQGMVTLEAAACGLPTVSTSVGMVPDYPALGITVPVGDDAALAATIADLLGNPLRLASMGRSARKLVQSQFTIVHTANHLIALYESLLA